MLSDMVQPIEQHVEWIADCTGYMGEKGFKTIESNAGVEGGGWVALVNEIADQTIFRTVIRGISAPIFPVSPGSSCHSWVSQIT